MKHLWLMFAILGGICLSSRGLPAAPPPANQKLSEEKKTEKKTEKKSGKKTEKKTEAKKKAQKKKEKTEQPKGASSADAESSAEKPAEEKAASAAEANGKEEDKEQKKDEPETLTVEKKPLKIEVKLDGVFEAAQTREIAVATDEWNQLIVEWAIGHGEEVKKGAPLLRFETRKIDLALADLEADVESTKLSVQQREAALESLEKSVPESLASARRAAQEASENLARFQETDKAEMIEDVAQNLQQTQRALAYQQEELKQLEKMYQADDLTEETEEIVLLRARHRVEAYQYRLEKVEKGKERFDEVILPRYEANLQQAATQTQLALEKAEDTLPATLSETRLSLEKLETDLRRKEEKLARLRRDRDEFTVVAPADGIVYYGQAVRGKWPNATAVAKMLSFKSAVKPQQVLLTIVKKNPLLVRATIDEKKLHQVKKGDQAAIYPAAYPQRRLRGKVDRMAAIPIAPGQFEAELSVKDTAGIRAGMACKVEIVVAKRAEAILVPSSAVQLDDDGRQGQVYLVKKDGQRQQKRVRVGHSQDDQLEIVSGLRDGDQILKENPDK